jgi:hypothetical protein
MEVTINNKHGKMSIITNGMKGRQGLYRTERGKYNNYNGWNCRKMGVATDENRGHMIVIADGNMGREREREREGGGLQRI